jgi:hypothetical protein
MSGCDFCSICDLKNCPKKGGYRPRTVEHIFISTDVFKKLSAYCKKKKFMKGESYYTVPDHSAALSFLLDKYGKL